MEGRLSVANDKFPGDGGDLSEETRPDWKMLSMAPHLTFEGKTLSFRLERRAKGEERRTAKVNLQINSCLPFHSLPLPLPLLTPPSFIIIIIVV